MALPDSLTLPDAMVYTHDKHAQMAREMQVRQGARTICNVVRRLHGLCTTEEQRYLCGEIMYMAQHMAKRLAFYKQDWDHGLWIPEGAT